MNASPIPTQTTPITTDNAPQENDVLQETSTVASTPTTMPTKPLKPRMLVLVGFPGSGKTTFSKQLCEIRQDWRRVNQDDMGNRQTCEEYTKAYLNKGLNVVIDRCNFDFSQRKVWVQLAWNLSTSVDCLVFDTSEAECSARINARQDHPTGVLGAKGVQILSRFINDFRLPTTEEGFERIARISPRLTPVYDEQAIDEVFEKLNAQPTVRHQMREETGRRGGYRGVGRGGYRRGVRGGYRGGVRGGRGGSGHTVGRLPPPETSQTTQGVVPPVVSNATRPVTWADLAKRSSPSG